MVSAEAAALMAAINKKYGKGAVLLGSDLPAVPHFPTGSLGLDLITGGGWPANKWCEVLGSESSGKSSVVHKTIAANQDRDPAFTTLWIAAEEYDHDWAQTLGVDTGRVIVHDTNAMEDACAVMLQAAESRAVDAIVLDSYPALIADAEDEKGMDEWTISPGARVMGKFFRKSGKPTKRGAGDRPLLGIIINQWRDKVGAFSPHGTPRTSPGGTGKNYFYYLRLEITRTGWIDEKRPPKGVARVGQEIRFKTLKNKSSAPEQVASVDFYFADQARGPHRAGDYDAGKEYATLAIYHDVVSSTGNGHISYGDRRWHGLEKFAGSLAGELDLREDIAAAVMAAAFGAA